MDKRSQAQAEARQKIAAAKLKAENAKALRNNPVPQYVEMPEGTGDAEADAEKDLGELEQGFRRRAADEKRRFALATDTEYWGAICFRSREQRDAFFAAIGVPGIGDRYFDGEKIAAALGIEIPSEEPGVRKVANPDPTWVEFVKE